MKNYFFWFFLYLFTVVIMSGCSMCSSEYSGEQKVKYNDLKSSQKVTGSISLTWEQIKLGTNQLNFKLKIAEFAGFKTEDSDNHLVCKSQFAVDVINPKAGTITERSAAKRNLIRCHLINANDQKSWKLVSLKGFVLDDVLCSIVFGFKLLDYDNILNDLTTRFGKGENRKIIEQSLLGDLETELTMWSIDNEVWALRKNSQNITLTHQQNTKLLQLPLPKKADVSKKPIKLDDIGLGGNLDLNAPLNIPHLESVDIQGLK